MPHRRFGVLRAFVGDGDDHVDGAASDGRARRHPGRATVAARRLGILVGLFGVAVLFGPEAFASFGDSARGLVAALSASVIFAVSLFAAVLVARHDP